MRDPEFLRAVSAASARLERAGRLKVFLGVLLLLFFEGLALFAWWTTTTSDSVWMLGLGALAAAGLFVAFILSVSGSSRLLGMLAHRTPVAWFESPSHGLVLILDDGLFHERGAALLPYDAFAPHFIAGAAYLEDSHGLRLQLCMRVRSAETQLESENFSPRDIRLPETLTPEKALKLSLGVNERAHALRH